MYLYIHSITKKKKKSGGAGTRTWITKLAGRVASRLDYPHYAAGARNGKKYPSLTHSSRVDTRPGGQFPLSARGWAAGWSLTK